MTTSSPRPTVISEHYSRGERATLTDEVVESMRTCTDDARFFSLQQDLIDLNVEVARSIASRYVNRGIALEDLEQVALLGLTKAARRFRPDSGGSFLSFSVPTMRGEVRRYFRDHGWMVRPPRSVQELQYRINQARGDLVTADGREPTSAELARHLDEPEKEVRDAMDGKGGFSPASLDRPAGGEDDASTLGDLLPDDSDEHDPSEARVILAPAVRRLGERDRRILRLRFRDGLTQREIAEDIGVTQMQVSRLLSRIFDELREQIGELDPLASPA